MKFTPFIIFGLLGLSACGEYKGLQANCFDGGRSATSDTGVVTRSANSLSFLPQNDARVSTKTVPVSDCRFTALGGPTGAGIE
jgi:hypothetical protein